MAASVYHGRGGGGAGPSSLRPNKHFNEGGRSEAWLDAEIPLPSLYGPRADEAAATATAAVGGQPAVPPSEGAQASTSTARAREDGSAPRPVSRTGTPLSTTGEPSTSRPRPLSLDAEADGDGDGEGDAIDPELRAQVERNPSDFLASVAEVERSRTVLNGLLETTTELQGRAQRLRTKLVTPYETLRTLQTDLVRLQLGTELVRRTARFETLRTLLEGDMLLVQGRRPAAGRRRADYGDGRALSRSRDEKNDQDEEGKSVTEDERARAIARASFTSAEMASLLTAPAPTSLPSKMQHEFPQLLQALTPIKNAIPFLRSAQDLLRRELEPEPEAEYRGQGVPTSASAVPGKVAHAATDSARGRSSKAQEALAAEGAERARAPVLSFGKRLEEFRQRMGQADEDYVATHPMYF